MQAYLVMMAVHSIITNKKELVQYPANLTPCLVTFEKNYINIELYLTVQY